MKTKQQVFLSYSSKDKERLQPLIKSLEGAGFDFWWDQEIPIGQTYDSVIEERLEKAKAVLVVWSKHSIASNWVKAEAAVARDQSKMIPVLIDDVKIPLGFSRLQTAKLINWQKDQANETYDRLVVEIKKKLAEKRKVDPTTPQRKKSIAPFVVSGLIIAGLVLTMFVWNKFSKEEPEVVDKDQPEINIDDEKPKLPEHDGSLSDVFLDGSESIREEPADVKPNKLEEIKNAMGHDYHKQLKLQGEWKHVKTMYGKEESKLNEMYKTITFKGNQFFEFINPQMSSVTKKGTYRLNGGFINFSINDQLFKKLNLEKLTKSELHLSELSKTKINGKIPSIVKQYEKVE